MDLKQKDLIWLTKEQIDQLMLTNFTQVFQPISSSWCLNWPMIFNRPDLYHHQLTTTFLNIFDPEDDFHSGFQNISHQQQFFSGLLSPVQSHYMNYWHFWVQTICYEKIDNNALEKLLSLN